MNQAATRVGFIGLGRMGRPMAGNILSAGFALDVYDLRRDSADELIARGALLASCPRAVAQQTAIVAIAVVDDAQVEDALSGPEGIFAGTGPGAITAFHRTLH